MTPSEVQSLVESLQKEGRLPAQVTQRTAGKVAESLARYFTDASASKLEEITQAAVEAANDALKTEQEARGEATATVGASTADSRQKLASFLDSVSEGSVADTLNLDFFLRVPQEVAEGAAGLLAQNWDQERVDEWPALELVRLYQRDVPRGSEGDKAGPENGWDDEDGRWVAACGEAEDDDALKVFEDTGRMVALKSSGVWQALGDGAGGYDDTLGNAWEPFAFNSGMGLDEVSADEAVELGLLGEGEEAEPAEIDFSDLLGLEGRAKRIGQALQARKAASDDGKGCLMAMVKPEPSDLFAKWCEAHIPPDYLAGDGVEVEPHVTIFYGFNLGFKVQKLQGLLPTEIVLRLGKVSRFECPEYDVLKLDVDSERAELANETIAQDFAAQVTLSQHEYHPHLTLAYVKKGVMKELDGNADFDGETYTVDRLLYSEPEHTNRQTLRLDRLTR